VRQLRARPSDVVRVLRLAAKEDEHALPLMVIYWWGAQPEWVAKGAPGRKGRRDIIDFNMGCPAKEVTGALSGSALMREPNWRRD
jgi:tRNA-dihydrouridine synthase